MQAATGPPSPASRRPSGHCDRSDEPDACRLRKTLLVVLSIAVVAIVVLLALPGPQDTFDRVASPVLAVGLSALLVGLLGRWLSPRVAGLGLFAFVVIALSGRLFAWTLEPVTAGQSEVVLSVLALGGVVYALAFVLFGTKHGVRASLVAYTLLSIGPGIAIATDTTVGTDADWRVFAVALLISGQGILIALLWLLASRLEQLVETRTAAQLLEAQAFTDPLTGVANRRRLHDEAERLLTQSRRYHHPLSLVLVDVDWFKSVNDRFGHDVGDEVLIEIVDRVRHTVRNADVLGRWGGEEFLVLAPHTDHAAAYGLAERCRRAIAAGPTAAGDVTASFGVATTGRDDDLRALQRRADLGLYAAKCRGRNRVCGIPDLDNDIGVIAAVDAEG